MVHRKTIDKKKINEYVNLTYPITIEQDLDSDNNTFFIAEITDLPGCSAHGQTVDEALNKLQDAKVAWIKTSLSKGLDIPLPESEDKYSGKILLRIPVKLHMQLAKNARKENTSLNQYIRRSLEQELDFKTINQELNDMQSAITSVADDVKALNREIATIHASICDNIFQKTGQSGRVLSTSVTSSTATTTQSSLYDWSFGKI